MRAQIVARKVRKSASEPEGPTQSPQKKLEGDRDLAGISIGHSLRPTFGHHQRRPNGPLWRGPCTTA